MHLRSLPAALALLALLALAPVAHLGYAAAANLRPFGSDVYGG